jgi:hypothetical protein
VGAAGPFEARYLAFLETITNLRPSLHRYCSRMTGSVMDGEDVVQEAQAYHLDPAHSEVRATDGSPCLSACDSISGTLTFTSLLVR